MLRILIAMPLVGLLFGSDATALEDHVGFCSWDELTSQNCSNVKYGGQWHCWCPELTTPKPPT